MVEVVEVALGVQNHQLEKIADWPKHKHAMKVATCKEVVEQLEQIPGQEVGDHVYLLTLY